MHEGIYRIKSGLPGPTVAIFAGLHGNELAGVIAVQELASTLKLTRGSAILVVANPPAVKANKRMLEKNMNRCFYPESDGSSYEDARARVLMKILDKCDALIDLHMFYDDDGVPFVICEENALELASKFDVDIISTNWSTTEPGATDGYMFQKGKIGVCIECGPISKPQEYKEFALRSVYQMLRYYDMTDAIVEYSKTPKRIIRVQKAIHKTSSNFKLKKGLQNFMALEDNQVIAEDGSRKYQANAGEYIIFPHYNARIGEEAYVIGTEIQSRYQ